MIDETKDATDADEFAAADRLEPGSGSDAEALPEESVPEESAPEESLANDAPPAGDDSGSDDSGPAADDSLPAEEEPADEESPAEAAAKQPPKTKSKKSGGSGGFAGSQQTADASEPEGVMDWYILKVQSNRENSIAEALQRRVAVAGLGDYFGEIIVPVEMVTEFKGGKKKVVKRKLYPGYIVAQMIINEETWFLVRETPGVGDFTGAGGKPTPMLKHEVDKIRPKDDEGPREEPKLKIKFKVGDRVKIIDGTFENFEGEVSTIDEASGRVTVMINIFGRSTPVELEYWQVEAI